MVPNNKNEQQGIDNGAIGNSLLIFLLATVVLNTEGHCIMAIPIFFLRFVLMHVPVVPTSHYSIK